MTALLLYPASMTAELPGVETGLALPVAGTLDARPPVPPQPESPRPTRTIRFRPPLRDWGINE